jgi:hypothetical protein
MRVKINSIVMVTFLTSQIFVILLNCFPESSISDESNKVYEESQDIYFFILNEGDTTGNRYPIYGNITTKTPESTQDEFQILYNNNDDDIDNVYWWFSDPLRANMSINGTGHLTIWAVCNQSQNISFSLNWGAQYISGGRRYLGWETESKIVYKEPVEFKLGFSGIENPPWSFSNFYQGERIGMGIKINNPEFEPPDGVKLLFNSSSHPSHMTINTHSVSINISNKNTSSEKASVDVDIIDVFGLDDIAGYDIKVVNPSGRTINNFEINETRIPEDGKIHLDISWDNTNNLSGEYTIRTTVIDNNGNHWVKIDPEKKENTETEENPIIKFSPLILVLITLLFVLLGYFLESRNRKKQNKKS